MTRAALLYLRATRQTPAHLAGIKPAVAWLKSGLLEDQVVPKIGARISAH